MREDVVRQNQLQRLISFPPYSSRRGLGPLPRMIRHGGPDPVAWPAQDVKRGAGKRLLISELPPPRDQRLCAKRNSPCAALLVDMECDQRTKLCSQGELATRQGAKSPLPSHTSATGPGCRRIRCDPTQICRNVSGKACRSALVLESRHSAGEIALPPPTPHPCPESSGWVSYTPPWLTITRGRGPRATIY